MPDYNYMPYSPYISPYSPAAQYYQQQLNQLAQQPPGGQQVGQFPRPANNGAFTVRPVTGIEEARATPIDGGTWNVLMNLGAGEIYVTRINSEGLKDLVTFAVKPPESSEPVQAAPVDVPKVDLSGVNEKLDAIYQMVEGMKNEQPCNSGNASNAGRAKPKSVSGSSNAEQPSA